MMTRGAFAATIAAKKAAHPELYCPAPGCLWRVQTALGASPCEKHPRCRVCGKATERWSAFCSRGCAHDFYGTTEADGNE